MLSADRERLLVELVDDAGRATGTMPVADAHADPGHLHRAFSVLLFDPAGQVLLQQRAPVKTRFALRWANSCCGHPLPGQTPVAAASVRIAEELGLAGVSCTGTGSFTYRATDRETGRVEWEYDHVLIGVVPTMVETSPDPAEVAALRWVDPEALAGDLARRPEQYSPWLPQVLQLARQAVQI